MNPLNDYTQAHPGRLLKEKWETMFKYLLMLNEIFFRNILMSLYFWFVFCTLATQNEGLEKQSNL